MSPGGSSMWSFDRFSRAALVGVIAVLLAACGFHLRGQAQLPFETLYIPGNNPLAVELKRNVAAASKTRLVDGPGDAQAVLGFTQELRDKIILSFSAAGRVSEYQLRYRVGLDRKSTRLNSSHSQISYAVFCLKKKKKS